MKEFELRNGQSIELTKDNVLIKGSHIEIDGNVTILKNDKHANIVEQDDEVTKVSILYIDDEQQIMEPDPISYGKLVELEAKLSSAITEIDKLKTTIKAVTRIDKPED